jgi:hypothetical protein
MSAVTINGVQVYGGGQYSNFSVGEHRIAYGYLDIYHDSDGKKTFSISPFTGWLYKSNNYSSNGGLGELDTIPRASKPRALSDSCDMGETTEIWTDTASQSFHHLVWYEFEGHSSVSDEWGADAWSGKYGHMINWATLTPTIENANYIPNNRHKTCTVYLNTYSDNTFSTQIGETKSTTLELWVPDNNDTKPTASITTALNNTLIPSATRDKFDGLYIQGKSRVDVTLSGEGKYNANINGYSTVIDGKTYKSAIFTSDVINTIGNQDIVGTVTDTRELTNSATDSISVVAYSKPLVIPIGSENAILCYRSDGNGVRVGNSTSVWIKAKMSYYSLDGKNQCALQWRRKLVSEDWNTLEHRWTNLIPKTNTTSTEYNAMLPSTVFDKTKSYTVQIRAIDDIGEYDLKTFEIPTQDVALHLGRGGKNVAVGTYCDYTEDYTFYSEWKAIFDKDVYIKGTPISNHVIEEGFEEGKVIDTDGNQLAVGTWTYRRWSNGDAECRGVFAQENVAIKTPWGVGLYESKGYAVVLPSELFEETPQFNITLDASGGTFLQTFSLGTKYVTPYMCAIRPEGTTTVPKINTSIVAYGRWKQ